MPKVNISSIVSAQAVMDDAFTHPALKIRRRSKKRPTIDDALKCVVNSIEFSVMENIAADVAKKLQEEYDMYLILEGERIESVSVSDWECGLDDVAERVCEEYNEYLSQDWLGRNTIDTTIHEENGVKNFSLKLGQEYYSNLVHGTGDEEGNGSGKLHPHKILSSAGITVPQVELRLEEHIHDATSKTEEEIDMAEKQEATELDDVITRMAGYLGKDYDILSVNDDLDLITDDDDLLSQGAAPRLGLTAEDIEVLRGERLIHGEGVVEVLRLALDAACTKKKAKKKPKKTKTAKPIETEAKTINFQILASLKECGANDSDMAKGVGVSRATYNNYAKGKTVFSPDEDQCNFIRASVVERANKLIDALAELDGTPAETLF